MLTLSHYLLPFEQRTTSLNCRPLLPSQLERLLRLQADGCNAAMSEMDEFDLHTTFEGQLT